LLGLPCSAGSSTRRSTPVPIQHFHEVLEARLSLRAIAEASSRSLFLASLEECVRTREEIYKTVPMAVEETRLIGQLSTEFIDHSTGTLTALGKAACSIRTVPEPCLILQLLLETGEVSKTDLVGLLSQALGDGRLDLPLESSGNEVSESFVAQLHVSYPTLASLPMLSQLSLTEGTVRWMHGASLHSLCDGGSGSCTVGAFCRHIVRVHDFLEEVAQALEMVDVVDLAETCRASASALNRGLPFLKRGSGRGAKDGALDRERRVGEEESELTTTAAEESW